MNLIVVGLSHRSAPVALLQRMAVPAGEVGEVLRRVLAPGCVDEAVVLSTCNRVEVYAGVTGFHRGLSQIVAVLAERVGASAATLAPHLYVHHAGAAVRHAYRVATGLDSMVVGEAQVLGQLRDAYAVAAECDATGRVLHELMQQALRVGKRAHAETGIDRAGQSVVSAALGMAGPLAGRRALVIGAGTVGALAAAALRRGGVGSLLVANRSAERAAHLARLHDARPLSLADVASVLSEVDIVVSATTSAGCVIEAAQVPAGHHLTILDLAVPRDVHESVAQLPGVTVIDMARLGEALANDGRFARDRAAVQRIVVDEADAFLAGLRGDDVVPTVAALRARADEVVDGELRRLVGRRPELTEPQRAEVARALHRVVQRLLHQPTVRARELAAGPGGARYTVLLQELFDLNAPHGAVVAEILQVGD